MEHSLLRITNPGLGLALSVLKEQQNSRGLAKVQAMTEEALEKLETKLDEAPVEKIFEQPKIEDARILRKITPEQASQIESKMLSKTSTKNIFSSNSAKHQPAKV